MGLGIGKGSQLSDGTGPGVDEAQTIVRAKCQSAAIDLPSLV